jgi:hypothetical protein
MWKRRYDGEGEQVGVEEPAVKAQGFYRRILKEDAKVQAPRHVLSSSLMRRGFS